MSTIIEWAGRVALVLTGWGLILLVMPMVGPSGRQVAVVGDPVRGVELVRAAGGSVVDIRNGAVLARSDAPGFALALYRAGAPLVIEGRIGRSCFAAKS